MLTILHVFMLQRLASAAKGEDERPPDPSIKRVTPLQSLWCAAAPRFSPLLYLHHFHLYPLNRLHLPPACVTRKGFDGHPRPTRGFDGLATFITSRPIPSSACNNDHVAIYLRTQIDWSWRRAAVQAGVFAYLLYLFSSNVDGYFERQPLPDQYTARNITVAISTIVRGLSYLITFIFGANAVGLSGESRHLPICNNCDGSNECALSFSNRDASHTASGCIGRTLASQGQQQKLREQSPRSKTPDI